MYGHPGTALRARPKISEKSRPEVHQGRPDRIFDIVARGFCY
jgi:hypothetical protein